MCLVSLHRFQLTFKPIKVYKIVVERDGQLYSPYQGTHVTKIMCGNFSKTCKTSSVRTSFGMLSRYFFEKGFIHAYFDKKTAEIGKDTIEVLRDSFKGLFNQTDVFKIIESYIPPFTRYATDVVNNECCARIMIFSL